MIKTLEQDRIRLQTELDLIKRDLEERNRELLKERTRIENMIRQEQVTNTFLPLFIGYDLFSFRVINQNKKYFLIHMRNLHKNVNYSSKITTLCLRIF